ncbi:hypothetical protein [Microbacterium sp. SMR1]|uniref:hypothetical protein n=1 Tax=Microbacterium sp. SMR1 TaxID=1497340 RepID=UPI0011BEFA6E|nr:hypothetical protein [Microbacterium sp. SMR1]
MPAGAGPAQTCFSRTPTSAPRRVSLRELADLGSTADAERERARHALLEREAVQANLECELSGHRSGALFPAMSGDRRTKKIRELEAKREQSADELQRLSIIVGDREEVVDSDGKLPAGRRRWNVIWYRHPADRRGR